MKKFSLLILFMLIKSTILNAQAVENVANWPSTQWGMNGVFDSDALEYSPYYDNYFAYNDELAGQFFDTYFNLQSPIINLTAAQNAGENWIMVESTYTYRNHSTDFLQLQYFDAGTNTWIDWGSPITNSTSGVGDADFCSYNHIDFISEPLDITDFTATQLSQFRYRITYDDNDNWAFGFCFSSPNLYSQTPPDCPSVANLNATVLSPSSAELSWDQYGTETYWNIDYGPAGFTQGNGTSIVATSNPFTLNNLASNTTYEYYVQANCLLYLGEWIGPFSFTTPCTIYDAPYNADFAGGVLPLCWNQGSMNHEDWEFSNTNNNVNTTNNTISNGYYAHVNNSFPHDSEIVLLSPYVNVSTLTTPALHFFLSSSSEGYINVDFSVDIFDGSQWNNAMYTSNTDTNGWELVTIDLSGLTITGPIQARFKVDETNADSIYDDLAIDDVLFAEIDYCFPNVNLNLDYVTATSAALNWATLNTNTSYNLQYGLEDFAIGSGTNISANGAETVINGLEEGYSYDIYIQPDCATSNEWYGPLTITTSCTFTAPFSEDFEVYITPMCWQNTSNPHWYFTNPGNDVGDDGDVSGNTISNGRLAHISASSLANNPDIPAQLTTPFIDVTNLTHPALSFFKISDNQGYTNVLFTLDFYDGAQWHENIYSSNTNTNGWELVTIDLTAYTITGDVAARFNVHNQVINNQQFDDFAIDDVTFDEMNACLPPANVIVDNNQMNQVDIMWDDLEANPTSWSIEYGPVGFTKGSGTTVTANTNPYTLTGLTDSSEYQFYITTNCANGYGIWNGPYTFHTLCTEVAPFWEPFTSIQLSDCWYNEPTFPYWYNNISSGNTGNNGDMGPNPTLSGDRFVMVSDNSNHNGTTMGTPMIDITTLTTPTLHFYLNSHNQGGENLLFSIDLFDGTTYYTDVYTHNTNTAGWELVSIDLSPYNTTGMLQAFFIVSDPPTQSSYDNLAIDDVMFNEPTFCTPVIENGYTNAITTNSATVNWSAGGIETQWNISVVPFGGAPENGTITASNTNSFNITELEPSTNYDVYIQSDCGSGQLAPWYGPISVVTSNAASPPPAPATNLCAGTPDVIYTNDFNNNIGWTGNINNNEGSWSLPASPTYSNSNGSSTTYSSNYLLRFNSDQFAQFTSSIVSPAIEITSEVEAAELSFYMYANGYTMGTLNVNISNNPEGPFTKAFAWAGRYQTNAYQNWIPVGIDISEYIGETIYIEFEMVCPYGSGNSDMSIDYLQIKTCTPDATCTPAQFDSTSILDNCPTNEYYININITDLGNGTPALTDGTNTWPVNALGTNYIGPFTPGSTVDITLLNGFDATCDVTVGTFTYNCPPANDNICGATEIPVYQNSGTTPGDAYTNANATGQTGEPIPACFTASTESDLHSVWFYFISPSSGMATITTDIPGGTLLDTEIAIYEYQGTSGCTNITFLGTPSACDQDSGTTISTASTLVFDGVTNPTLTPDTFYWIQVNSGPTATEGTFGLEIVALDPANTASFNELNFSYYPNPVNQDMLYIEAAQAIDAIEVYNMLGQTLIQQSPKTSETALNTQHLASGQYLVKVVIGNNSNVIKIIKE